MGANVWSRLQDEFRIWAASSGRLWSALADSTQEASFGMFQICATVPPLNASVPDRGARLRLTEDGVASSQIRHGEDGILESEYWPLLPIGHFFGSTLLHSLCSRRKESSFVAITPPFPFASFFTDCATYLLIPAPPIRVLSLGYKSGVEIFNPQPHKHSPQRFER